MTLQFEKYGNSTIKNYLSDERNLEINSRILQKLLTVKIYVVDDISNTVFHHSAYGPNSGYFLMYKL